MKTSRGYHTETYSQPLTIAQSQALVMNFALGSKAKLALTSSLGKLNSKLRMSSPFSGVIQNNAVWSSTEQYVWVVLLLAGMVLLHSNRITLPFALSEMSDWNASFKVSTREL